MMKMGGGDKDHGSELDEVADKQSDIAIITSVIIPSLYFFNKLRTNDKEG